MGCSFVCIDTEAQGAPDRWFRGGVKALTTRRRMEIAELEDRPARPRAKLSRLLPTEEQTDTEDDAAVSEPPDLPEALLTLCSRFEIEPWAAERDERGVWGFAVALSGWIERRAVSFATGAEAEIETIRLLTNLFIILGAVIRPLPMRPITAEIQACAAIAEARRRAGGRHGLVASFPGAGRAMQRLVKVRGWTRLSATQQSLAEALLGLYLETLGAALAEPAADLLLAASEAWLTVIRLQALPPGFDERLLRATSWYLESFAGAVGNRQPCSPLLPTAQ
jgi:hypothetical protein